MSSGPVVLAASRLLLSLRNRSCCAASIDLLFARQSLIRKTSNSVRAGSMSDAHLPNCPPMTAIVVTKKNLPSFSEKRAAPLPPFTVHDEAGRRESNPVPSSTAVESALRSALGIGHSETCGGSPTAPTAVPQLDANVSAQDPAILDWSLCNPDSEDTVAETEPKPKKADSTRILRLLHGGENEGESANEADRADGTPADRSALSAPLSAPRNATEADTGLNAVAAAETNSSLEPSLTSAGVRRPLTRAPFPAVIIPPPY
uniref:Uncharacterized protein n=1 Tax=Rhipicephalus pulchellus TaxID=72859 RepID=L7M1F9_RHIPC